LPDLEWLAIETSHPAWLLDRWEKRFGLEAARSLACADNQPPPACLRSLSPNPIWAEIESQLRNDGVELSPGRFLQDCRVVQKGNITRTNLFRQGTLLAQDEASQIVPLLLDVQEGHRVLDLCAAPGNKTAPLAVRAGPSGHVVACDLHWHRLREMITSAFGAPLSKVALDGCVPIPFRTRFDRILVDAPCSGTGTLRRHPEIKWRLQPSDIEDLAEKQFRLLDNAAAALDAHGRLVYSTCSLEPEENRGVLERFLASHPEFRLLPLRQEAPRLQSFFLPAANRILANDFLETFPDRDGTDGFFAAILTKKNT
jgi:16S rRNA (cytosine967-C5)-methyltransferase